MQDEGRMRTDTAARDDEDENHAAKPHKKKPFECRSAIWLKWNFPHGKFHDSAHDELQTCEQTNHTHLIHKQYKPQLGETLCQAKLK